MDENYDDVKAMNTLALQSKILTIREKQIEENKRLEQDWLDEQRRLDTMMELERLKALQAEFDREERAKQARLAGAQVLIEQIASRQEARNKELEMLEKEKLQLLQNIEKVKKEDEEVVRAKAHRVRVMQDEIKESNSQSLVLKEAARVAERKVEASILEHNRIQREREEAKIEAERRIREEKEKEI